MPVFRKTRPKSETTHEEDANADAEAGSNVPLAREPFKVESDGPGNVKAHSHGEGKPSGSSPPRAPVAASETAGNIEQPLSTQKSWYGGTWPRTPAKSLPVTQLVTENSFNGREGPSSGIQAKGKTPSVASSLRRAPSLYMSPGSSARSLPSTSTIAKVNVSSPRIGHTQSHDAADAQEAGSANSARVTTEDLPGSPAPRVGSQAVVPGIQAASIGRSANEEATWGMTSWIPGFRAAGLPSQSSGSDRGNLGAQMKQDGAASVPIKTTETMEPSPPEIHKDKNVPEDAPQAEAAAEVKSPGSQTAPRPRSWFGIWGNESSPSQAATMSADSGDLYVTREDTHIATTAPQGVSGKDAAGSATDEGLAMGSAVDKGGEKPDSGGRNKQGRWSWWSGQPSDTSRLGEIASEETSRQTAQGGDTTNAESNQTGPGLTDRSIQSRKRVRPVSSEINNAGRGEKISKQGVDGKTSATASVDVMPDDGLSQDVAKSGQSEQSTSNLLLPLLKQTYGAAESPSLLERLSQYFVTSKREPLKHVSLAKESPKIKHAIAIGVHGYFPTPFIRSMIGQPKGTSVKFATMGETAIRKWCEAHNCDPKVDKVVLEGEGKIEERVTLLWKLLIKHIELIREADFILVACHSQGVPVAVQLVDKLIQFGVMADKRVSICAMAGVNLGPFPEYKSRWIGGSAGELFDFANLESQVSVDYETALMTVLQAGTKILFVGSIDDQLVSMDSATFGNVEHPGLYRAVFINSEVHAPSFVVNLVGFALKLRNLGIPDHGLIRELSNSLAGSFTGDGHSRLYEDPALYNLAIEFALETTPCERVAAKIQKNPPLASQNPYILPFAMRGVLEEKSVKSDLHDEMNLLLMQFDQWKPLTKQLKDVKFRLEGVRSKM